MKTIEELEYESDMAIRAREAAFDAKLRAAGRATAEEMVALQAEADRAVLAAQEAAARAQERCLTAAQEGAIVAWRRMPSDERAAALAELRRLLLFEFKQPSAGIAMLVVLGETLAAVQ